MQVLQEERILQTISTNINQNTLFTEQSEEHNAKDMQFQRYPNSKELNKVMDHCQEMSIEPHLFKKYNDCISPESAE